MGVSPIGWRNEALAFDLRFEFVLVGDLYFLRYRAHAKKKLWLAGRVSAFVEGGFVESHFGYEYLYVVLFYECARYLPVLCCYQL